VSEVCIFLTVLTTLCPTVSEANVAWRLKKEAEAKKIIPAYQGPSGVEVSVKRQLEVIQGCGKQDNGSILEHLAV